MIIEGRTIKNIEEMLEFCKAAVAATHADPSAVRLHIPQDARRRARTCGWSQGLRRADRHLVIYLGQVEAAWHVGGPTVRRCDSGSNMRASASVKY